MTSNRVPNEALNALRRQYATLAEALEAAEASGQPANSLAQQAANALQSWVEANEVDKVEVKYGCNAG